jgi:hypothetical protein
MRQGLEHETMVLDVLTRAVAEALERKRRLGHYYVAWRDGRGVCIGPDAPPGTSPDDSAPVDGPEATG